MLFWLYFTSRDAALSYEEMWMGEQLEDQEQDVNPCDYRRTDPGDAQDVLFVGVLVASDGTWWRVINWQLLVEVSSSWPPKLLAMVGVISADSGRGVGVVVGGGGVVIVVGGAIVIFIVAAAAADDDDDDDASVVVVVVVLVVVVVAVAVAVAVAVVVVVVVVVVLEAASCQHLS